MTDTEQPATVDLRTRIAAAFEAEDARNWGYDHEFAADDAETLAFADVAIAVMTDDEPDDDGVTVSQAAMEETLASADKDRDQLAALVAERDAEIARLRRERDDFRAAWKSAGDRATKARVERDEARAETKAMRATVNGWISDANDGFGSDPNDLAGLLEDHDASRAPESPANAPGPSGGPATAPDRS